MHLHPKQLLVTAAVAAVLLAVLLTLPQSYLPYNQRVLNSPAPGQQQDGPLSQVEAPENTRPSGLKLPQDQHQQQHKQAAGDGATSGTSQGQPGLEGRTPAALLVVDVQQCFLPGGALPTQGGHDIIPHINQLRQQGGFDLVVFTQDWHPAGHVSFASTWQRAAELRRHMKQQQQQQQQQLDGAVASEEEGGERWPSWLRGDGGKPQQQLDSITEGDGPQPQDRLQLVYTADGQLCNLTWMYPQHSVACAAAGAAEPPGAPALDDSSQVAPAAPQGCHTVQQVLWPDHCIQGTTQAQLHSDLLRLSTDVVLRKGSLLHLDAYSAFFDNGHVQATDLTELLRQAGMQQVFVVGVALDYCVLYTALDAVKSGFQVVLVVEATAAVSEEGRAHALEQLQQAGVQLAGTVAEALRRRHTTCSVASH
jgi:nicotinamidase/pyrazinamidase